MKRSSPSGRRWRGEALACAAGCALLAGTEARAVADCSVSSTGVAFGIYDPTATAATDSTGNLTLVCTYVSGGGQRVNYTVALSTGYSGTFTQRWMRGGPSTLNYNLFDTAARARIWGDGSAGTVVISDGFAVGPGQGNNRREVVYPIYGRIPAQQAVDTGNYSDTIVVTLTF
jgi:spore coat protein U-like protein